MAFKTLKLIAPNSLPIVGVKVKNGEAQNVVCNYDKKSNQQDWVFPLNAEKQDGYYIFVDKSGNEWPLDLNDLVLNCS